MATKTYLTVLSLAAALTLSGCGGAEAPTAAPTAAPAPTQPAPTQAVAASPTAAPAPTEASAATEAPAAPTATEASAATETPASADTSAVQPGGDAKEALLAAMRKQFSGGPYRLKTTITSDKSTIQMDGEVVPPDQMHMLMDSAGTKNEMIYIGDKGWMKMGDKWQTSPIAGGEIMSQIMQNVDEMASTISNVKYVGEESLDGKSTQVYTYHVELGADKGNVKSDAKVWIDSASGRIVKSESEGEAMGIKSKTVQTIEYDPSIKIEAPVK